MVYLTKSVLHLPTDGIVLFGKLDSFTWRHAITNFWKINFLVKDRYKSFRTIIFIHLLSTSFSISLLFSPHRLSHYSSLSLSPTQNWGGCLTFSNYLYLSSNSLSYWESLLYMVSKSMTKWSTVRVKGQSTWGFTHCFEYQTGWLNRTNRNQMFSAENQFELIFLFLFFYLI